MSTDNLQYFNLSQAYGSNMPQWPSSVGLDINVVQFHAKDGVSVLEIIQPLFARHIIDQVLLAD